MRTCLLSFGGVLAATAVAASAQVPDVPDLTGVGFRAVVSQEFTPGVLRFGYRIDNTSGSLAVDSVVIGLDSDASRSVVDVEGFDNSADILFSSAEYRATFPTETFVAVAFPSAPASWIVGIDWAKAARWGAGGEAAVIPVGQSLEGFTMLTRALPGIRDARISADILDFLPSEEELEDPADLRDEVAASDQVVRTVAPVAPPATLSPSAFVQEIDDLRSQTRAQGWIATDALSSTLQVLLSNLSAALDEGRTVDAKIAVRDFLRQVDPNSCTTLSCTGKPLTTEAYALLHYNMEYLRAQLPNVPPDCSQAVAAPNLFWPPNHEMVEVSVTGVSDADGDPLEVVVTAVSQDEGVLEAGSGAFCPDAVLDGDGTAMIRSERAGRLNGRVYRISYSATDTVGAACSGVVRVCMPHRESTTPTCIEETEAVDSTSCP